MHRSHQKKHINTLLILCLTWGFNLYYMFIMILDPIQKISSARLNSFPPEQKDTTWVSAGVAPTPTQKLDLHEKKFEIDPKASFIQIIQRDLYEMVILDLSWLHKDLSNYLTLLSSIHQPPKAILFLNIHLTPQNHQSWKSISNDSKISLTVDLFHIGLVFLNLKMEKQHFVLKS